MLTGAHLAMFDIRLALAVYDINEELRMAVEVKALADIVREAKAAISEASNAAADMRASAKRLTATVSQVKAMHAQLEAANADLQAAVGGLTNGGPPLETTTGSVVGSPGSGNLTPEAGIRSSTAQVAALNAGA